MKRCPQCGRDYNDDSMSFCLDDGADLLFGPANISKPYAKAGGRFDEPQTAIMHDIAGLNEGSTRAQVFTTDQTDVLPSGITELPRSSTFDKRSLLAPVALALIVLGGFFVYRYVTQTRQIESIAVMPFVNDGGNPDAEFLSDGMTETLIGSLTQLPDLNVKARSSVFRYKGKETDTKAIGQELNVQAILNGRVIQRGEQLTLSLELVDVATENAIWSRRYDRKRSDLVVLQSEIARDVSSKLRSKISSAEAASVEKAYTANADAYQLYLQGRYHWNKREIKEFQKAVEFFKQAIERDPNYALAYSGLADTNALFEAYGDFRAKDYLPQAKEAALKALELDPDLAEAHASYGEAIFYWDYDWAGAEKAYKRAIELDPKYATAHLWYGELLALRGRHDEALREISTALELEPFSMIINREKVKYLRYAKRFDEALSLNKKVNDMFPDQASFHGINGTIYEAQGNYAQAFEEYWLSSKSEEDFDPEDLKQMRDAFDKGGWDGFQKRAQEKSLRVISDELAQDKDKYIPAINYATAYGYGRDREKTLEYLNKALEERSMVMLYLKVAPQYFFLHDDPRFKELVRKVGIPE